MSIFQKIKSLFGGSSSDNISESKQESSDTADSTSEVKQESSEDGYIDIDDVMFNTFLQGEAEYRHQTKRFPKAAFGEKIELGKVVDFLIGENTTSHIVGLIVCHTHINSYNEDIKPYYIEDAEQIRSLDIVYLVNRKCDDGNLGTLTGENVTLTVLRDNGLPIVMFVRNMYSASFMRYTRVYTMVSGTNANDDKRIMRSNNQPICDSTLLAYRSSNEDISDLLARYDKIEAETLRHVNNKEALENEHQKQILEGIYMQKPFGYYKGYADWQLDNKRPYDAFRQYLRIIHGLDNPAENLKLGEEYGEINYKAAESIMGCKDPVRAFHYLDIANFFNANHRDELLKLMASLGDYRVTDILEQNKSQIPPVQAELARQLLSSARNKMKNKADSIKPYLTVGFILEQAFRVHDYNIFSLNICRINDGKLENERIDDRKTIWDYKFADLLHSGTTIILSYSRSGQQCKIQDFDQSLLCPDNSIIMHVNDIEGSDMMRVDALIPAFAFDPNKMWMTRDFYPERKTFVVSKKPQEYDFSKSLKEIFSDATSLEPPFHSLESLPGALYVYYSRLAEFDKITPEERGDVIYAAFHIGYCFMEFDMKDVADYYLNAASAVGYGIDEYINFLANSKDVRAMSTIDRYLLRNDIVQGRTIQESHAFLKRRKAYVLIDWRMFDEAKELLNSMLADPLCSQFAQHELEYLSMNKL